MMYNTNTTGIPTTYPSVTPTNLSVTAEVQEDPPQHFLHIIQIVCFCTISIVGTIGNLIICTSSCARRRKSSEYFILNLAIADLMVCAVGIPLDIYEKLQGDTWPYGPYLCHVIYPSQTLLVLISIMTLTAMSLERYRAIVTPLKNRLGKASILAIIACIWVLGISVVAPYARVLTYNETQISCDERWPGESDDKYYTLALFIIDYCIPLTIIIYCYSKAGYELHKKFRQFKTRRQFQYSMKQDMVQKKRLERNQHVIKLFSFAVLVFVICTLPGDCYWMWDSFGNISTFKYGSHFQTFANILLYANSAINPFIFGACQLACRRGRQKRLRRQFSTTSEVSWANNNRRKSSAVIKELQNFDEGTEV